MSEMNPVMVPLAESITTAIIEAAGDLFTQENGFDIIENFLDGKIGLLATHDGLAVVLLGGEALGHA
ncbi:hypothetical protein ACFY2T_20270 [Streptomyces sp. NPDC001260]|uniref:hypothetical protein n=1 Tax=Streptomyces sp. NPDC001260 TaxID=3364551 RepID=UPI00367C9362